jgi:hypothetical protein
MPEFISTNWWLDWQYVYPKIKGTVLKTIRPEFVKL